MAVLADCRLNEGMDRKKWSLIWDKKKYVCAEISCIRRHRSFADNEPTREKSHEFLRLALPTELGRSDTNVTKIMTC